MSVFKSQKPFAGLAFILLSLTTGCLVQNSETKNKLTYGTSLANLSGPSWTACQQILTARCVSCHQPGGGAPTDFSKFTTGSQLIDAGYVVPGHPEQSRIYQYMKGSGLSPGNMPLTGIFPQNEVDTFAGWITSLTATVTPSPTSTVTPSPTATVNTPFSSAMSVISNKCVSCHNGGSGRDFTAYLSNEQGWISSGMVVAGSAQSSSLYQYLQGTGLSPGNMPLGLPALTAIELTAIQSWINQIQARNPASSPTPVPSPSPSPSHLRLQRRLSRRVLRLLRSHRQFPRPRQRRVLRLLRSLRRAQHLHRVRHLRQARHPLRLRP